MTNLLKETIKILEMYGKTPYDVDWVGSKDCRFNWADFAHVADVEYDAGFGSNEVCFDLVVVGKDFWLERNQYDGSEWWEYKTLPEKPSKRIVPKTVLCDEPSINLEHANEGDEK